MAQFTITIADAQVPRVRAALCAYAGYRGADVTNAHAREALVEAVKNIVRAQEELTAWQTAQASIPTDVPDVT